MDVSGSILANLDAGNPCRHDVFSELCLRCVLSFQKTASQASNAR
jgi:hypothetical protein